MVRASQSLIARLVPVGLSHSVVVQFGLHPLFCRNHRQHSTVQVNSFRMPLRFGFVTSRILLHLSFLRHSLSIAQVNKFLNL